MQVELAVVVYHMGKSFKILMFSSNIERKTISILQTKCKNFPGLQYGRMFCQKVRLQASGILINLYFMFHLFMEIVPEIRVIL